MQDIKKVKTPIIVFDIDGTLIHRTKQRHQQLNRDFLSNGHHIYLRPNIYHLAYHFDKLAAKSTLLLWTSMMKKNAIKIQAYLSDQGLKFERLYTQEDCLPNLAKDLRVIAEDYNVDVSQIYLVDDSPNKRVNNQNMIVIEQYTGANKDDKEIIRIIKELYGLLNMQFEQKYIQEAENYEICNRFNKVKINYVQKIEDQVPNVKEDEKNKERCEQKQERYEQKEVQKQGNRKEQRKKNKKIKQVNETEAENCKNKDKTLAQHTKIIVFDLNKTLIIKQKTELPNVPHLLNPSKIQNNIIYNRPSISILQQIINLHPNIDIKYLVWTTMTGKSTTLGCLEVVKNLGVQFFDVVNGIQKRHSKEVENDREGVSKDLNIICEKYGGQLENALLIDDSYYKNVKGQNFMLVHPYTGDPQDKQMIRIALKIDKFINCTDQNCQIKKQAKNFIQQFAKIEKQLNEGSQKTQILRVPVKKQISKKQQVLSEQKKQRQNANHKIKVEQGPKIRPQLSQNCQIKCIVFDINQTLLFRSHHKLSGIQCHAQEKHYFYLRPHLQELINFILEIKDKVAVCLWSTITARNCEILAKILQGKGFHFKQIFYGEQLVHHKKDLQFVGRTIGIDVQNIVLVDDSPKKRVKGQNFIQIEAFDPYKKDDDALLYLIKELSMHIENENKGETENKLQ